MYKSINPELNIEVQYEVHPKEIGTTDEAGRSEIIPKSVSISSVKAFPSNDRKTYPQETGATAPTAIEIMPLLSDSELDALEQEILQGL